MVNIQLAILLRLPIGLSCDRESRIRLIIIRSVEELGRLPRFYVECCWHSYFELLDALIVDALDVISGGLLCAYLQREISILIWALFKLLLNDLLLSRTGSKLSAVVSYIYVPVLFIKGFKFFDKLSINGDLSAEER